MAASTTVVPSRFRHGPLRLLRSLSMSPAFVPSIKEALRCTTESMAQEIARRVLRMTTVGEVRGYLTRKIRKLCPNVSLLDMRR